MLPELGRSLAIVLIVISILLFTTQEAPKIFWGTVGLVMSWLLLGMPGLPRRRPKGMSSQTPSLTLLQDQGIVTPRSARQKASQAALGFRQLNHLPSRSRLMVINVLELDEQPEFAVAGEKGSALVGTDRRVFVIPEGRDSERRMMARPYSRIANAQLIHHRHGGRLVLRSMDSKEEIPVVSVVGEAALSHAIDVIAQLRRRISDALVLSEEQLASPAQSAFVETAHASIPSTERPASLTLGDMLTMSPTEFEEFTGKALEALGYRDVKRVGGAGDLAADLTATDPQGRSAIVQCKRYTPGSRVGSPALQAFIGMRSVHHKADRGIFVTTADYTQQAIDLANEHDIVLIDGDDLVKIAALVLTPSGTRARTDQSGDARFCSDCGEKLQPAARFCSSCGTAT